MTRHMRPKSPQDRCNEAREIVARTLQEIRAAIVLAGGVETDDKCLQEQTVGKLLTNLSCNGIRLIVRLTPDAGDLFLEE